jgi:pimeloyl-ACP methyl ester carboxylesterase
MEEQKIIIIPGFKGSFLADKQTNKRIWITIFEALLGNSSLKLETHSSEIEKLRKDGIFERVSIIPSILEIDIYGSFLQYLKKSLPSNFQVISFSYDWRKGCLENVRQLDLFIKNHCGPSSVILLAHSMGGLIASYFLRYGTQNLGSKENWYGSKFVSKIVFAGVPFQGSPRIFSDLHQGVRTLLNTSLLGSEALFSFPSTYELLPISDNPFIYNSDETESFSIYKIDHWVEYGWSIFRRPLSSKQVKEEKLLFLNEQLKNSIDFRKSLLSKEHYRPDQFPKILNLIGISKPTLSKLYILRNSKKSFSFKNSDGDETVLTESANLPKVFKQISENKEVLFPGSHRKLFNKKIAFKEIIDFLID